MAAHERFASGNRQTRGQLSLEALLSFAALLSAFAVLIAAASHLGGRLALSSEEAAYKYSASYIALCLDEAAQSTHFSAFRMAPSSGMGIDSNRTLFATSYPSINESLFFGAGKNGDEYAVQQSDFEPEIDELPFHRIRES